MRGTAWLASALAFVALAAHASEAAADTMDPALNRLVLDSRCRAPGPGGTGQYYDPASGFSPCTTDDAAFAKLIAQYGFAIAPTAMHSARTTGYGGFEIAIEGAFTKIDSDATYWQQGTQGPQDKTSKNFSVTNPSPDPLLQLYMLKIRKGFPFGLELQGVVGYLANTNIVSGGADVRLSLLEGFRTGIPGIFPDVAVGGAVRTITGTEQFQLTVAGFDTQISKQLPIAGTVTLTPYVGYQFIRIFGDSGLIDLTPNTDAVNYCGYQGPNSPATKDPKKDFYDGQPVCSYGTSADFNNTIVFDPVRLSRHRINFGMQLRWQMVKFGMHFLTDVVSPEAANKGADYETATADPDDDPNARENKFKDVGRQWTLAFDLGAVF